jgi:hypothetical protein
MFNEAVNLKITFQGFLSKRDNVPYYDPEKDAFWDNNDKIWFKIESDGNKRDISEYYAIPTEEELKKIEDKYDKNSIIINSGWEVIKEWKGLNEICRRNWENNKSAILEVVSKDGKLELNGNSFGAIKLFGFINAIIEDDTIDDNQRKKILDSVYKINLQSPMIGSKWNELKLNFLSCILFLIRIFQKKKPSIKNYIDNICNSIGQKKLKCPIKIYYSENDELIDYQGKENTHLLEQLTNIQLLAKNIAAMTQKNVNVVSFEGLKKSGKIPIIATNSISMHEVGFRIRKIDKFHLIKEYLYKLKDKIKKKAGKPSENFSKKIHNLLQCTTDCLSVLEKYWTGEAQVDKNLLFNNQLSVLTSKTKNIMYKAIKDFNDFKIRNFCHNLAIIIKNKDENPEIIESTLKSNIKLFLDQDNDIYEMLLKDEDDGKLLAKCLSSIKSHLRDKNKTNLPEETIKNLHNKINLFENRIEMTPETEVGKILENNKSSNFVKKEGLKLYSCGDECIAFDKKGLEFKILNKKDPESVSSSQRRKIISKETLGISNNISCNNRF